MESVSRIAVLKNISTNMGCLFGEPLQETRGEKYLTSGIRLCFAILPSDEGCDIFFVHEQEVIPGSENSRSLSTRFGTPSRQCIFSYGDGSFDVLFN